MSSSSVQCGTSKSLNVHLRAFHLLFIFSSLFLPFFFLYFSPSFGLSLSLYFFFISSLRPSTMFFPSFFSLLSSLSIFFISIWCFCYIFLVLFFLTVSLLSRLSPAFPPFLIPPHSLPPLFLPLLILFVVYCLTRLVRVRIQFMVGRCQASLPALHLPLRLGQRMNTWEYLTKVN